jgi:predicted aminopeptidase
MLRIIRFLLTDLFLLTLCTYAVTHPGLILYGIAQGRGELAILTRVRPVEEVMKDPTFPDSLKKKLALVSEIRMFATDSLGLQPSDNYTTLFDQHNQPILWTITASEPFRLKAKEWDFPFLGTVSYKGFFNYEKGKAEAKALLDIGYDVDYGGVSGWSTLGWFKDPILSSMLRRNEGHIADLIIHELTHGTLYVKNKVEFNENLASFIGDKGAERFLAYKYGKESGPYQEYTKSKADRTLYNKYMLQGAERLDSLYRTFPENGSVVEKEMKKMKLIYDILEGVKHLPLFHKSAYLSFSANAETEKNAFFMSFRRYDAQYDVFEKEFRETYRSDIRLYIQVLAERMRKH